MTLEQRLLQRSEHKCELCAAITALKVYEVPPQTYSVDDNSIIICDKCRAQLDKKEDLEYEHWKCLTTSMWSEVAAVQVVSWRLLNRLRSESWAADSLDMMYLDDEKLIWAKATGDHEMDAAAIDLPRDSNGAALQNGDTVVLTKSLDVKGSTINAKLGTVVKNIRLVDDNTEQVEGRIEGQVIVILTKYLRKQNG